MANSAESVGGVEGLPLRQLKERDLGIRLTEKFILEGQELETDVEPRPTHGTSAKRPCLDQIFTEPFGISHKQIGGVAVPPCFDAQAIARLPEDQRFGAQDVLVSLSPGLFTDIQLLAPLFHLAGDPLETEDERKIDWAYDLRSRLLEYAIMKDSVTQQGDQRRRCFFTIQPPWLLPTCSPGSASSSQIDSSLRDFQFGKTIVLMTDPRYLVMRQIRFWEAIRAKRKEGSVGTSGLYDEDFLTAYLQEAACLAGHELQRLASWVIQEYKQPDKVKIIFVEDFILEPEVAVGDLARFLGVPEQSELLQTTVDKLMASKDVGLCYPRTDMLEMQHFLTVCSDFEQVLARLPVSLQDLWDDNLAVWSQLPNPRIAALGNKLQNHALTVEPMWWPRHYAGICRACCYAPRGTCSAGDVCLFCHAPSHALELRRKSKRQRDMLRKHHMNADHTS